MRSPFLALVGLLPFSMLFAQFSVEFSSQEGYSDRLLSRHPDWQVFDGSKKDSATFTVDTAQDGRLLVDPTESAFQVAAYDGPGGRLASDTYYVVCTFRLIYPEGSSSELPKGAVLLPAYEIQNTGVVTESVSFGLRQVPDRGRAGSQFNLFTLNKLNGSTDAHFSPLISREDLGLSIDGSAKWTDGTSDLLVLLYSLLYDEAEKRWMEKVLLANVETAARIATFSRALEDADNSFADNPGRFRLYGLHMSSIDVAVALESVSLKTAKE